MTMSPVDVRHVLTALGWPAALPLAVAVRSFQVGWALGPALLVDGIVGPVTSAALEASATRALHDRSTAGEHFSFREFACSCGGRYRCPVVWVRHELVRALETLRAEHYPHGLGIRSGCRCRRRNTEVGGAVSSQHLYGAAADIPYATRWESVRDLGVFSGIGRSLASGLVRHVDVRHVDGHNPALGTTRRPTIWTYDT